MSRRHQLAGGCRLDGMVRRYIGVHSDRSSLRVQSDLCEKFIPVRERLVHDGLYRQVRAVGERYGALHVDRFTLAEVYGDPN